MSGSGFKVFVDGDVLSASDVNGYLMEQAVVYYATTTARNADTPFEGKVVYIASSNEMQFYTGTAWIRLQDVQVFNAKGDLVVGTGADDYLRLSVGTDGHVLTADSNETRGVKWAEVPTGGIADGAITAAKLNADVYSKPVSTNEETASYTLVLADAGKVVEMNVASANTLTVPTNTNVAFPVGTTIMVLQTGSGQTTIAGASGVTVNAAGGGLKINGQWAAATLIKRATDTWAAIGALTA
jgi:hypothetical protein